MIQSLKECGIFEVIPTTGAFYFFVRIALKIDGTELANSLAQKHDLIILPGEVFGQKYPQFVRFSFARTKEKTILQGFNRINDFINHL
jgi:aspartate/methionine/tyrosine aminotransferase